MPSTRAVVSLASIAVAVLVAVSGCSTSMTSPNEIRKALTSTDAWKIDARWTFASPEKDVVMTGTAIYSDRGESYVWAEHGFGMTTVLVHKAGKISTPQDAVPVKDMPSDSIEAVRRIERDLFSYDPLVVADRLGIRMEHTGKGRYRGSSPCTIDVYSGDQCASRVLVVEQRDLLSVVTLRSTRQNGMSDTIVFEYSYTPRSDSEQNG